MKSWCEHCFTECEIDVVEKELHYKDDYNEIVYLGKTALCKICHHELYNDEIEQYNQKIIEDTIRNSNKTISISEIEEITKKYNIGKRPLSIILGLGELTITRYLSGYIPTKEKSDFLYDILNNPNKYLSIIKENKDSVTNITFEKTYRAVMTILNLSDEIKEDKIMIVSKYIVDNNYETSPLALQKLLHYVQLSSYMFFDKPMYNNRCSAWDHGPVYGYVYYQIKEEKSIKNALDKYDGSLTRDEQKICDAVIKYFGCYSPKTLEAFTHTEELWINSYKDDSRVIEKEEIKNFAKKIKASYGIEVIDDIKIYSDHLFKFVR